MSIVVRRARKEDCAQLLGLMHGLAKFEKYFDGFRVTEQDLELKGFAINPPQFSAFVAENAETGELAGMAVTYSRFDYSGRQRLVMKELFVEASCRGQAIGEKLVQAVCGEGLEKQCFEIVWTVADWNKSGKKFYLRNGANEDRTLVNYNISEETMHVLAQGNPNPDFTIMADPVRNDVLSFIKVQPAAKDLDQRAFTAALALPQFQVLAIKDRNGDIQGVAILSMQEFHFTGQPKLLLEGLFVQGEARQALLRGICKKGVRRNACGIGMSSSDQEEQNYFVAIGAAIDPEWINYRFSHDAMIQKAGAVFKAEKVPSVINF